jgi:hypothetical protein
MSCLEGENANKKQNIMRPSLCNDDNNCYVADYLSNFASIITVGKEIVDLCLDGIRNLSDP